MPSLSSTFEKLHLRKRSRDSTGSQQRVAAQSTPNLVEAGNGHAQVNEPARRLPTTAQDARPADGGVKAPAVIVKDAAVPPRRTSLDQDVSTSTATPALPRSPAKFELPTIPQTPTVDELTKEKQLGGTSHDFVRGSHAPPKTPPKWSKGEVHDVYATRAELAPPRPLLDSSSISSASTAPTNAAYVASRSYSYNPFPAPAHPSEHQAHIAKHLPLLEPRIFQPTNRLARSQPGRIKALAATPPVSTLERDRVLDEQRDRLAGKIAWSEQVARDAGLRAPEADDRALEIFDRAGWSDRVGVVDTLDVHTKVLPPVIQEHVRPVETVIYQLMIFREVHKYHIYPYIQPIRDPSPKVLPTRHLFRDRDGNLREVYGDEAAELVLGRKLDASTDGETYVERWTEGVDGGIEYQTEMRRVEDESVVVGRRAFVAKVGSRAAYDERLAATEGGRYMVENGTPMHEAEFETPTGEFEIPPKSGVRAEDVGRAL